MNISIPEEMQTFIDDRVKSGQYHSTSEVVCAALQLLQEQEKRSSRRAELERELLKGVESSERGRSRPFDAAAVEQIKSQGRQRLASNKDSAS
jgi:antitoxin ParD1/3/4